MIYHGHFQIHWSTLPLPFLPQTKAPAQPAPFTQQTAIPNEGRDMRGAPDQRQQQPGDQQHTTKPFAPQQSTSILGDGGDGRSPPQNANRPPAESSPPQVFTSQAR